MPKLFLEEPTKYPTRDQQLRMLKSTQVGTTKPITINLVYPQWLRATWPWHALTHDAWLWLSRRPWWHPIRMHHHPDPLHFPWRPRSNHSWLGGNNVN